MTKFINILSIISLAGFIFACTGPLTKSEKEKIHTIGVLNSFPASPTWTKLGTTIFTNHISTAEARGYKELLTQITINYLKERGYQVKELSDKDSIPDEDVNFRIELQPWDTAEYVHTKGYGFVERSFMGLKKGPFAYVVMHIVPRFRTNDGFSDFGKNSYYQEKFQYLPINNMPPSWESLPDASKDSLEKSLKSCIQIYMKEQLPKLGL